MLSIKNPRLFFTNLWHQHRWALITGLLTGTSYIPFFPWASLFNYAPLWWFWIHNAETRRQVFWSGWLSQFVLNLIGFHWVYHTAHEFGHIPAPLSALVLLLFASLAHLFVPLVGVLVFEIKQKFYSPKPLTQSPIGLLLTLVGLWGLAEIFWPYIFQWHMGYTLFWAKLPIFHWADIVGFQGLSYLLLLFNGFFVWWTARRKFTEGQASGATHRHTQLTVDFKHWTIGAGLAVSVFVILNLGGWLHGQSWQKYDNHKTINFLAVQANIGNAEKIMAERGYGYQDYIVQRFIELSRRAVAEKPEGQILIWPESAIPDYLDQEFAQRRRPQLIQQFLRQTGRSLITGGYSKELKASNDDLTFNALFMMGPQGQLLAPPYRKKHLLAFGEYTPFGDWFPKLNEISPSGKGFSRGPGPQTVTLQDPNFGILRIAPQICYEALYPEFSRQGALTGAQILMNVTNDSWFGRNAEPYQHLSMTFARAIENRRPLLRVTNTGFTSAVEASGRILARSPLYEEWSHVFAIPYQENPPMTLYTRYGNFWPFVVLLFTLIGLGLAIFEKNGTTPKYTKAL